MWYQATPLLSGKEKERLNLFGRKVVDFTFIKRYLDILTHY